MNCALRTGWWLSAISWILAWNLPTVIAQENGSAADVTALVALDQIRDHVGKEVLIEFKVKASKFLDGKKICFLNSQQDHKSKENFAVIIKGSDALTRFAEAKIPDPAKHYRNKFIRVRGKVTQHFDRPQIIAEKVSQIEVLPDKPESNTVQPPDETTAESSTP